MRAQEARGLAWVGRKTRRAPCDSLPDPPHLTPYLPCSDACLPCVPCPVQSLQSILLVTFLGRMHTREKIAWQSIHHAPFK